LLYAHFLVTYKFGLIKRGLIGEVVSLLLTKVSYHDVLIYGLLSWFVTLAVYLQVFRKIFTFSSRTFPLLAVILCSPFFFKNFMFSIGYFDILGCLAALIALLLPINAFFPLLVGALCCVLLLIHHLHFLLYIPTIAFIVVARALAASRLDRPFLLVAGIAAIANGALFLLLAFHGSATVPMDDFITAMRERAATPEVITGFQARVWYTDIRYEIGLTMAMFPGNILRVPVYAALVFIHLPLIAYLRQMIRSLTRRTDRIVVIAGLTLISLAYLPIFAIVYDYSRWVSNWATCMMLAMHAVYLLPSSEQPTYPIDPRAPRNRWFGWIIALVPRVGIIKPL
jgi:hypothetical protein